MWEKIDELVRAWEDAPRLPACFLGFGLLWFWGCMNINCIGNPDPPLGMLSASAGYQNAYVIAQALTFAAVAAVSRRTLPLMQTPVPTLATSALALVGTGVVIAGTRVALPNAVMLVTSAGLGVAYALLFALWCELCGRFPGVKMVIPYLTATIVYFATSVTCHYVDYVVNVTCYALLPPATLWCLVLSRRAAAQTAEPAPGTSRMPWQVLVAIVALSAVFDVTGGFVMYSTTNVLVRMGRLVPIVLLLCLAKFRRDFDFSRLYVVVVSLMVAALLASLVTEDSIVLEQIVVQAGAEGFSLLTFVICCSYAYRMHVSAAGIYGLATATNLGVRLAVELLGAAGPQWLRQSWLADAFCVACVPALLLLLNKPFLVASVQPLPADPDHRKEEIGRFVSGIGLSPQEKLVFEELAKGQATAQIADALFISPSTVRVHLSAIYRKAGVHSREELLAASGLARDVR